MKANGLVNALTCLEMLFSATAIPPSLSNQSMFSTATAPHCEDANMIEIGQCEFNCDKHFKSSNYIDLVYREMPVNVSEWNEFMCGEFHRSGTLCGECDQKRDFFPQAYSYNFTCTYCENGSSSYWLYITVAYLPLTTFYILIFLLKVDINSSQLQGFIIFSQFILMHLIVQSLRLASKNKPAISKFVQVFASVYGIWNLNFFCSYENNICFKVGSLASLSLELGIAIYPLVLMTNSYIMIRLYDLNFKPLLVVWQPFKLLSARFYRQWSVRTSFIDVFAAFFFLASIKSLLVCIQILYPIRVVHHSPMEPIKTSWQLYHDPNIAFLSPHHLVFAIPALIILLMLFILPVLTLLLFSITSFHKGFNCLPHCLQIFLFTFVDSYQGCYKDGTDPQGSKNCMWYAWVLYISRPVMFAIFALTKTVTFFPYGAIVLTALAMVPIIIDPFRPT